MYKIECSNNSDFLLSVSNMLAKFKYITITSQTASTLDFTMLGYKNTFRIKMVEHNSMSIDKDERPYVSFDSFILKGNTEIPFTLKYSTASGYDYKTSFHKKYATYEQDYTVDGVTTHIYTIPYSMTEFTSYDLDNIYISISNSNISFMGKYNAIDKENPNSGIDNCIVSYGLLTSGSGVFAYTFSSCKSDIAGYTKLRSNFGANLTGFPVITIVGEHDNEVWCSFNMDNKEYSEVVSIGNNSSATVLYRISVDNYMICYSTLLTHNLDESYEHVIPYYGVTYGGKLNSCGTDYAPTSGEPNPPLYKFNPLGYGANTSNGIATVLPSLFYIKEQPYGMNTWSYIGKSDELNYVNMYNMSSYHILQKNYPVSGDRYVCITQYKRRKFMYDGLAIRLTNRLDITEDDTSVVPSIQ